MGQVDNEASKARATIRAAMELQGKPAREIDAYFERLAKDNVDVKEVLTLAKMGQQKGGCRR